MNEFIKFSIKNYFEHENKKADVFNKTLKKGDKISAEVIETKNNEIILNVDGTEIQAKTDTFLQKGDTVKLEIIEIKDGKIILRQENKEKAAELKLSSFFNTKNVSENFFLPQDRLVNLENIYKKFADIYDLNKKFISFLFKIEKMPFKIDLTEDILKLSDIDYETLNFFLEIEDEYVLVVDRDNKINTDIEKKINFKDENINKKEKESILNFFKEPLKIRKEIIDKLLNSKENQNIFKKYELKLIIKEKELFVELKEKEIFIKNSREDKLLTEFFIKENANPDNLLNEERLKKIINIYKEKYYFKYDEIDKNVIKSLFIIEKNGIESNDKIVDYLKAYFDKKTDRKIEIDKNIEEQLKLEIEDILTPKNDFDKGLNIINALNSDKNIFEFMFLMGNTLNPVDIKINFQKKKEKENGEEDIHIFFELEMENAGKLELKVNVNEKKIEIIFVSEKKDAYNFFIKDIKKLEEALYKKGYKLINARTIYSELKKEFELKGVNIKV